MKLCECGCGKPAPIAQGTNEEFGHVKGEPVRFILGHSLKGNRWMKGRKFPPIEKRFWAKVKESDECWTWTGAKSGNGYGAIRYKGKQEGAHRVSWILANGEIPDGMLVRHKCDNPVCVRPDHLQLGTVAQNSRDMVRRGRAPRAGGPPVGERNPSARLTRSAVREIKKLFATEKATVDELAEKYDVSDVSIRNVIRRKTWKHVR